MVNCACLPLPCGKFKIPPCGNFSILESLNPKNRVIFDKVVLVFFTGGGNV